MPNILTRAAETQPSGPTTVRTPLGRLAAPFDLVLLARRSSGDKHREAELLAQFDRQCGLALAGLRGGAPRDAAAARMLSAAARLVGAHAIAAACDACAAVIETGGPDSARSRAVDILAEEIGIARAYVGDVFGPGPAASPNAR